MNDWEILGLSDTFLLMAHVMANLHVSLSHLGDKFLGVSASTFLQVN